MGQGAYERREKVRATVDGLLQPHTFDQGEKLLIYGELLMIAAQGLSAIEVQSTEFDAQREALLVFLEAIVAEIRAA